eukprot:GHVT01086218.1.p1 GENE.GHVT01086218.1~~GHVT01086218.1.p1  ORF type:complete len:447 (+),score=23.85 GHVT01086218.1:178-1518(+)
MDDAVGRPSPREDMSPHTLVPNGRLSPTEPKDSQDGPVAQANSSLDCSYPSTTPNGPGYCMDGLTSSADTVVVDTGAFVRLQRLERFGDRFFVTPGVEKEIRDARARQHLLTLLETPIVMQATEADVKWTKRFAGLTGDLGRLSPTDIEVVALTYMLQRQTGDTSNLKTDIPGITTVKDVSPFCWGPQDLNVLSEESAVEEKAEENLADQGKDGLPLGLSSSTLGDAVLAADREASPEMINTELEGNTSLNSFAGDVEHKNESDGEDSDGEWITENNIFLLGRGCPTEVNERHKVACMTTDFAMQNVLLQMGLRVITPDGQSIRSIRTWGCLCRACQHFVRDSTKLFCPKCGHNTVSRVPITVGDDGQMIIHDNRTKKYLRGTIYSIPKTRGGRHVGVPSKRGDLILTEDQLLMGGRDREHRHRIRQWEKELADKDPFNQVCASLI